MFFVFIADICNLRDFFQNKSSKISKMEALIMWEDGIQRNRHLIIQTWRILQGRVNLQVTASERFIIYVTGPSRGGESASNDANSPVFQLVFLFFFLS